MKNKYPKLLIVLFFLGLYQNICSAQQNTIENKRILTSEFQEILDSFKLQGSILVLDTKNKTYYSNDYFWAEEGHLPASTFKIPNALIALELGIIKNEKTILPWDGKARRLKIWEQDLDFKKAFQVSCVPCFQEIARQIGEKRMHDYLLKIAYPGMLFDSSTVDLFWLQGESKISQFEQIDFLKRFYFSELPISKRTQAILLKILEVEKTKKYTFSGKSGWGIRNGEDNGWYVGYLEVENNVYIFATNVIPKQEFNLDNFTTARIQVTKAALESMEIIKFDE